MGPGGLNPLQGYLEYFRTGAGEGPTAQPATVVVVIDANYLVDLFVGINGDTGARVERLDLVGKGQGTHAENGGIGRLSLKEAF